MINRMAEFLLAYYQRHLSPKKGYCCAHDILSQSGSCSDWALLVVWSVGLLSMEKQLPSRRLSCREANLVLALGLDENAPRAMWPTAVWQAHREP